MQASAVTMMMSQLSQPNSSISSRGIGRNGAVPNFGPIFWIAVQLSRLALRASRHEFIGSMARHNLEKLIEGHRFAINYQFTVAQRTVN